VVFIVVGTSSASRNWFGKVIADRHEKVWARSLPPSSNRALQGDARQRVPGFMQGGFVGERTLASAAFDRGSVWCAETSSPAGHLLPTVLKSIAHEGHEVMRSPRGDGNFFVDLRGLGGSFCFRSARHSRLADYQLQEDYG